MFCEKSIVNFVNFSRNSLNRQTNKRTDDGQTLVIT